MGQFYVPENNTQLDQLAVDVAKDTGMEIHVERLAGDELGVKTMAVIGSGRGADLSIGVEFDTYIYAPKLADVTDLAEEIGKNYGGWFDVAKQACIVGGRWKSLCLGQAPAVAMELSASTSSRQAGISSFSDTFDDLLKAAKILYAKGTPIGMTPRPTPPAMRARPTMLGAVGVRR